MIHPRALKTAQSLVAACLHKRLASPATLAAAFAATLPDRCRKVGRVNGFARMLTFAHMREEGQHHPEDQLHQFGHKIYGDIHRPSLVPHVA